MIPHAVEKKDDEESIVSYDNEKILKEIKWYDRILLNRPLKVVFALLFMSILAPVLIYRFIFFTSVDTPPPDGFSFGSCIIPRTDRIPCGLGSIPVSQCHQQCCYDLENNLCFHRVPSRFSYLIPPGKNWTEEMIMTPRFATVPFNSQPSITGLQLSVDEISSTHLSLTFYDSRVMSLQGSRLEETTYSYRIISPELAVFVEYENATDPIFSTMRGPIIASENIWEIAFKLTDQSMYGLGEVPLKPGTVKVIYNHNGGFNSIPLIFAKTNVSYHGLLIDVKEPTEVCIGEANQVVVRSITKTGIKLHLFTGPEPKDIMKDVMDLIGTPKPLEYWMLGAHVCTEVTEDDDEALTQLNTFIQEATSAGLRYESHCGIKPIVFESEIPSLTTTPVVNGATSVVNAGKQFVPHISPYIRYEPEVIIPANDTISSNETAAHNITSECANIVCQFEDLFLQLPSENYVSNAYVGSVLDSSVVYPDYSSENITELLDEVWEYDVVLSGAVLENNWPLDDSIKANNETNEDLPYFSKNFEEAFNITPQWNAKTAQGDYYLYNHNEYGNQFVDAFKKKINQTSQIPIYSTSQWMRTDVVVNRQEVPTSWLSLRQELVQAALGGVSGNWLWSSPICGDTTNFNLETHASLCIKWYMAGIYFPMLKVHSKSVRRDALAFEGTHRSLIVETLNRRMSLNPYFYTVLQEGPLLRPMFYQFPFAEDLVDLSNQFSVGDALLIAPNLQPLQSHVHIWMPPGTWYEFWSGQRIPQTESGIVTLTTTEAEFITLIRGGYIVPMQKVVQNTAAVTRLNSDFTLVVATKRGNTTDEIETDIATGELRMSENMTVHFTVTGNQLLITSTGDDFTSFCDEKPVWSSTIRNIEIYGLDAALNDFDNHKSVNITSGLDLCYLKTEDITFILY